MTRESIIAKRFKDILLSSCSVLDLSEPGWTGEKNESIFDPSSNRDPLNKEERESGAVEAQLTPASSPGNNLHKICSQLSPQLINYDFVFVELNCPNGTSKCEMEVAIEKLFRGVCNDAMVPSSILFFIINVFLIRSCLFCQLAKVEIKMLQR